VDYEIERVEVFELHDTTLEKTGEFSSGETVVSQEFQGLEVNLKTIFV
jgi:Uma2 family endonuclease